MGIAQMFAERKRRYLLARSLDEGLQLGEGSHIVNPERLGSEPWLISIGKNVIVDQGVRFFTHDGSTWVYRDQEPYKNVVKYGRITIHDNSYIGSNAILLPGVTIGPNAIVAPGAVVGSDVPPNKVVRGSPAKVACGIEEYAEECKKSSQGLDASALNGNKKKELLRIFPKPW